MKKTLDLLARVISLTVLLAVGSLSSFSFSFLPSPLVLFVICLILCPFMGVFRLTGFVRALFCIIAVFTYGGGVFALHALGGEIAAFIMLAIGTACLGILIVNRMLPKSTAEEVLLALRGMKAGRARKNLLLRQSFSCFFHKGDVLLSLLTVFCLLIEKEASPDILWSSTLVICAVSLVSHLLYCVLDTNAAPLAKPKEKNKKGKYIIISILSFFLVLIAAYVYVGTASTVSNPSFATAIRAAQTILSPALIAAGIGLLAGSILGYILSLVACRFFYTIFGGIQIIPTVLLSALLFCLLPPTSFAAVQIVAITVSLFSMSAFSIIKNRMALLPYKDMAIYNRKQALTVPFVIAPLLAHIPNLLLTGIFSSVLIDVTTNGILCNLADFSFTLTASILAVTIFILLILSFLTKEARSND